MVTATWHSATASTFVKVLCAALCFGAGQARADEAAESQYYRITTFETPKGAVIEACGFALLENGKLAAVSRRGEIWLISEPFATEVKASQFHRFAHGLHEPLTLAEKDGWLYVVARGDVSRLRDNNGDGVADEFQIVCDEWGISGDYHEYAFGSKFDENGDLWIVLCLTGSFSSEAPYRGWCVRVTRDGKLIPTTSGIRSPGGIGVNLAGDHFYTENQGPWNGACALKPLIPGRFVGHPGGFRWYDLAEPFMGKRPEVPRSGSRFMTEARRIPELEPPAVLFPYNKMGQSASGIAVDCSGGKFGPFAGQLFVSDQAQSIVMRCFLEKVKGHYQGACFPFRAGFGSGNVGMELSPRGSLFIGGTNRGWGSRGSKPFAIERLDWTGKTPFEILSMEARRDGFELTFTETVDPVSAGNPASFTMTTFTYIYQEPYGSPEVDQTTPIIEKVEVSEDRKRVRLRIKGLQEGHVHELHAKGVRSSANQPLLHDAAYYTLNYLVD